MLSISALSGGPGYYLELANINYYAGGGEPLPLWAGTAAKELGLSGIAEKEHVEKLCAGFHHETGKPLVRNAGKEEKNPGHDLTFSAPKSVSIAWAMADEALRAQIQQAQESAVRQALKYIEHHTGFARVGAQGQNIVKCPLLFALFEHATSRANDPQLHTHALLINLTVHGLSSSGKPRCTAIDSTLAYHHKMAGGAIYRAALAENLKLLGFQVEQKPVGASIGFELKGISQNLIDEFSKRRAIIERELKLRTGSLDVGSYKYAELICKETRRSKDKDTPRAELFKEWQKVGLEYGVNQTYIRRLIQPERPLTVREKDEQKQKVWDASIEALSNQQSHWNERELTKAVAERGTGILSAREIRELIAGKLRLGEEVCSLGSLSTARKSSPQKEYVERWETRFTTPQILQLEREMMRNVEKIVRGEKNATPEKFSEKVIERYLREGGKLDTEQKQAVKHLTSGPAIRLMTGVAGTGKTTALKAAVEVWRTEDKDRQIIGCAVAGAAMQRLVEGVGKGKVEGLTAQQLVWRLENDRIKLDKSSVVILDEAGMMGTKQMAKIIGHIEQSGARFILVGDAKQLQPINAGGPFKLLEEVLTSCALTVIRRQKEFWARDAVKAMHEGRADDALYKYIEAGRFSCSKTREEAMGKLIDRWQKDDGVHNPQGVFLIAALNSEVKKLNELAQAKRIDAGLVDKEKCMHANGTLFHVGDRVQFQERSKKMGLENSDCGTILAVDEKRQRMKVVLDKDGGREVEIDFRQYSRDNLRLGYASTVHKAQGASLPHVHVLLGGPLTDQHMGYVQMSRSIESSYLFTDEASVGDPAFSDLIRSLGRSNQKTMALDVMTAEKRVADKQLETQQQERERLLQQQKEQEAALPHRPIYRGQLRRDIRF